MGVAVAISVSADFVEDVSDSGGWTFSSGDGNRSKSADSWISGCSLLASGGHHHLQSTIIWNGIEMVRLYYRRRGYTPVFAPGLEAYQGGFGKSL